MGFNISGIVINKNLESNTDQLSQILKLDLEFDREIDFETASENWKEEGFIDVYFSENGTMIFANEDLCLGEGYAYPDANILTFASSETSMAFNFSYTENNDLIRSKLEVNGEVIDEYGNKLTTENENEDISEVIWNKISVVLGKKFWDIQPEEKSLRFYIKSDDIQVNQNSSIASDDTTSDIETEEKSEPQINENPNNSLNSINTGKRDIKPLIILFAFALLLLLGLVYAIYSIFVLL